MRGVVNMAFIIFIVSKILNNVEILVAIIQIVINVETVSVAVLVIVDVFFQFENNELPESIKYIDILPLQLLYEFVKVIFPLHFLISAPQPSHQIFTNYITYPVEVLLRLLPIKALFDIFVMTRCLTKTTQDLRLIDINTFECGVVHHDDFTKKLVVNGGHCFHLACWSYAGCSLVVRWLSGWLFACRTLVVRLLYACLLLAFWLAVR